MRQISCVILAINVEESEPLEMKETERIDIHFQQLHCHHFVSFLCAVAIYFVALILFTYSNSCLTNQTKASLNWAWHIKYSHYLLTIRKWHDYWFMTANEQRIQNMCVCVCFLLSHRPISWCPSIFLIYSNTPINSFRLLVNSRMISFVCNRIKATNSNQIIIVYFFYRHHKIE